MREIKFRGRDKRYDGTWEPWMYGSLDLSDLWPAIIENGPPLSVQRETVGQYTGLKDKNGVEIYEGDVVEADCGDNGFMVGVVCYWHKTGAYMMWTDTETGFMLGVRENRVIGNVFDNPELKERFWKIWEGNQK